MKKYLSIILISLFAVTAYGQGAAPAPPHKWKDSLTELTLPKKDTIRIPNVLEVGNRAALGIHSPYTTGIWSAMFNEDSTLHYIPIVAWLSVNEGSAELQHALNAEIFYGGAEADNDTMSNNLVVQENSMVVDGRLIFSAGGPIGLIINNPIGDSKYIEGPTSTGILIDMHDVSAGAVDSVRIQTQYGVRIPSFDGGTNDSGFIKWAMWAKNNVFIGDSLVVNDVIQVGDSSTGTAPKIRLSGSAPEIRMMGTNSTSSYVFFSDSANARWQLGYQNGASQFLLRNNSLSNNPIEIADGTSAITFNENKTFPTGDGTANQVIQTDGAGTLSWTDQAGAAGGTTDSVAFVFGDTTKYQVDKAIKVKFENGLENTPIADSAGIDTTTLSVDTSIIATLNALNDSLDFYFDTAQTVDTIQAIVAGIPGGLWDTTGTRDTVSYFGASDTALKITRDGTNDTTKLSVPVGPLLIQGGTGTPVIDFGVATDLDATRWDSILTDVRQKDLLADGSIEVESFLDFNPDTLEPAYQEGRIFWDSLNDAPSYFNSVSAVTHQIGQEMWVRVKNTSGSTIGDGKVVYIDGASGSLPTIQLADADLSATCFIIGVATHDILTTEVGYVTIHGAVRGVDLQAFSNGDIIYLSQTAGEITATPPTSPACLVQVGVVTNNAADGTMQVTVDLNKTLAQLSDVLFTGLGSGDFLRYNGTVWVNVTSITSSDIENQTIIKDDIDTTGSNFSFDAAYHVTTAVGDSAYITASSIFDSAQILRAEMQDSAVTSSTFSQLDSVYNNTVNTIAKGAPVYSTGWNVGQGVINIDSAKAASMATMPAIGVLSADLAPSTAGTIVKFGDLANVNTSSFAEGDAIYVGEGGGYATKPTNGNQIQSIGQCERSSAPNGIINVFGASRVNDLPNMVTGEIWYGAADSTPLLINFDSAMSTAVTFDNSTIDTNASGQLRVKTDGVTTSQILNQTILPSDIDSTQTQVFIAAHKVTGQVADSAYITAARIGDSLAGYMRNDGDTVTGTYDFSDGDLEDINKITTDTLVANNAITTDSLVANVVTTDSIIGGGSGVPLLDGGISIGDFVFSQDAFHVDSTVADSAYVTANTIGDSLDLALRLADTAAYSITVLLSADTAMGDSLGNYFDTAAVFDTVAATVSDSLALALLKSGGAASGDITGKFFDGDSTVADSQYATRNYVEVQIDTLIAQATILNPGEIDDTIPFFYVDSLKYPSGITVLSASVGTSADGVYSLSIKQFSAADPPASSGDWIDTLEVGASDTRKSSTTFEVAAVSVGEFLYLGIPSTAKDWIRVTLVFKKD